MADLCCKTDGVERAGEDRQLPGVGTLTFVIFFVKVENESDGKMICCDLGLTNKNLICFALLTNSSKWFYPADGCEVFLDTYPCVISFLSPLCSHKFTDYQSRGGAEWGWRLCLCWYPFQMLARLDGVRPVVLELDLVVFSSRCDASCWFLHMFERPYPNTSSLGIAAPLLICLHTSPPTVAGIYCTALLQSIRLCLSPAPCFGLPVKHFQDFISLREEINPLSGFFALYLIPLKILVHANFSPCTHL